MLCKPLLSGVSISFINLVISSDYAEVGDPLQMKFLPPPPFCDSLHNTHIVPIGLQKEVFVVSLKKVV
jgi:hypothetical protein